MVGGDRSLELGWRDEPPEPLTFAWSAETGAWELGWHDEPPEPLVDDEEEEDEEPFADRRLEAASRAIARLIAEAFASIESFDALVARLGNAEMDEALREQLRAIGTRTDGCLRAGFAVWAIGYAN